MYLFEIKRSSQLRTLLKRVVVNRTWKKFRPIRDLNPWPLRYQCSALPIVNCYLFMQDCVEKIREDYQRDWKAKEMRLRQRFVYEEFTTVQALVLLISSERSGSCCFVYMNVFNKPNLVPYWSMLIDIIFL